MIKRDEATSNAVINIVVCKNSNMFTRDLDVVNRT